MVRALDARSSRLSLSVTDHHEAWFWWLSEGVNWCECRRRRASWGGRCLARVEAVHPALQDDRAGMPRMLLFQRVPSFVEAPNGLADEQGMLLSHQCSTSQQKRAQYRPGALRSSLLFSRHSHRVPRHPLPAWAAVALYICFYLNPSVDVLVIGRDGMLTSAATRLMNLNYRS